MNKKIQESKRVEENGSISVRKARGIEDYQLDPHLHHDIEQRGLSGLCDSSWELRRRARLLWSQFRASDAVGPVSEVKYESSIAILDNDYYQLFMDDNADLVAEVFYKLHVSTAASIRRILKATESANEGVMAKNNVGLLPFDTHYVAGQSEAARKENFASVQDSWDIITSNAQRSQVWTSAAKVNNFQGNASREEGMQAGRLAHLRLLTTAICPSSNPENVQDTNLRRVIKGIQDFFKDLKRQVNASIPNVNNKDPMKPDAAYFGFTSNNYSREGITTRLFTLYVQTRERALEFVSNIQPSDANSYSKSLKLTLDLLRLELGQTFTPNKNDAIAFWFGLLTGRYSDIENVQVLLCVHTLCSSFNFNNHSELISVLRYVDQLLDVDTAVNMLSSEWVTRMNKLETQVYTQAPCAFNPANGALNNPTTNPTGMGVQNPFGVIAADMVHWFNGLLAKY